MRKFFLRYFYGYIAELADQTVKKSADLEILIRKETLTAQEEATARKKLEAYQRASGPSVT
ncbi:hypothetical protein GCM10007880_63950 [Mesorhizobium amorphae]|nr:hypothetical protein GCM10007880_63950 [Mesorhizobium amorphae]